MTCGPRLMAAFLLVELAACGFDSSGIRPPTPRDTGVQILDGAASVLDERTDLHADAQHPTTTCAQIFACRDACSSTACAQACRRQGSAEAKAKLDVLLACWSQAAAGSCKSLCTLTRSDACAICQDQSCAAEEAACYTPPLTGSKSCSQLFTCYSTCPTDTCYFTCFYQGTADAQAKMSALEACWGHAAAGVCNLVCSEAAQSCWSCEDQQCVPQNSACHNP
jgi:hypothetical protein